MSSNAPAETMEIHGCRVVLRRVEGGEAGALFLLCRPLADAAGAGAQADAVYRAITDVLEAEGGSFASVVRETLFLRDLRTDLGPVRAVRQRALASGGASSHRPATTEIEQPPLDPPAALAVSVQALLPRRSPLRLDAFEAQPACGCAECARSTGLRLRVGEEVRFHAAALYGPGEDAYAQTLAMFGVAEEMLQRAGLEFGDVVRTWIHLREMERDYAALNRARRAFFEARGIDPLPASTGIGGAPAPQAHDLCLGIQAARCVGAAPRLRTPMCAPTLNEATLYGSDFARGMRVEEGDAVTLHLSGTASIDEAGRTAHPGDLDAQVDRMLVNVAALLEGQGAGFADVVSAVTYVKRPADAARVRDGLREAGFEGFPNALVAAAICRPELLCEVEAIAFVPRAASKRGGAGPGTR